MSVDPASTPAPVTTPTQKSTVTSDGSSDHSAVIIRFVTALVAFGLGAAALIYIPDPNVKVAATGIIGAAAFAIEKQIAPS